jgi:TfoX/Sxy family transcriptional regulator of competence genes
MTRRRLAVAYDEGLAVRIEELLADVPDVERKRMFGGLAFMVKQHMCVGVIDDMLMARVGPAQFSKCLKKKHAREMTFTGKPLVGMVFVEREGIHSDDSLKAWIDKCLDFVVSLPPRKSRERAGKA